jgi:hypothetical protein
MSISNMVERSNPEDMPEPAGDSSGGSPAPSEGGVRRVHPNTFVMTAVVCSAIVGFGLGWLVGQGGAGAPVVGSSSSRSHLGSPAR